MDADQYAPTIVLDQSAAPSASPLDSLDVSKAAVGLVAGGRPRFADETAELLSGRLQAAALIMTVVLALAFAGNLLNGTFDLLWLRLSIIVGLIGCLFLLRQKVPSTLNQLRLFELAIFGGVLLQLSLMLSMRVGGFAAAHDAASAIGVTKLFMGAWCVIIAAYSIFLPNSWKRGAAVMIPMAVAPYVVIAIQQWRSPELAAMLAMDKATAPIPMTLVAALVGTYGTHVINTARREAFKARQLGQYRLLDRLGGGGMGVVYKAEHVLLKRPCAIKLIKPENEADATAIAHFEKEVKTTAKLTHWNTIEIYDYGHADDGTFYYVMELLPGLSLEELIHEEGRLPAGRVVHLMRQVCGALEEAHQVGLIHRDLKPANIFAAQRGGVYDVAKLLDFGLVKEDRGAEGTRAADDRQSTFSGTPLYMSPEQAFAYDDVDGRADIYALGAVAYHLLCGKPPFNAKNVVALLAAHANSPVAAPSTICSDVPPDLEKVVLTCLAKRPEDRYPDAATLRLAFGQCDCAEDWSAEQAAAWWSKLDSVNCRTPQAAETVCDGQTDRLAVTQDLTSPEE